MLKRDRNRLTPLCCLGVSTVPGAAVHFKSQDSSPGCPHCGTSVRFARTIASDGLPDLHALQCDLCGLAFSGDAVAQALEVGTQVAISGHDNAFHAADIKCHKADGHLIAEKISQFGQTASPK